jgi:hypothetical protein
LGAESMGQIGVSKWCSWEMLPMHQRNNFLTYFNVILSHSMSWHKH